MLVNAKITSAGSCERNWSTFELIHSKSAVKIGLYYSKEGSLYCSLYISLTKLKLSGIAIPTSTGLFPMKTLINWPF